MIWHGVLCLIPVNDQAIASMAGSRESLSSRHLCVSPLEEETLPSLSTPRRVVCRRFTRALSWEPLKSA